MKILGKKVLNAKIGYDPDGYPDIYVKYGNCPDCGQMVDENTNRKCPNCRRKLDWDRTIVKEK